MTLLCELGGCTVGGKHNGTVMAKPTNEELLEIAANESTMTGPGIDQKIYQKGNLGVLFWVTKGFI